MAAGHGVISERECASKYGVVRFIGWVISEASKWEDYSNYFGEGGGDFQELGHCPLFGVLWSASDLGTVMAPVWGVSFSRC